MANSQRPSRLSSRATPYGEVVDVFGNEIRYSNGAVTEIDGEIFGQGFITQHPTAYNMVRDLVGEVVMLRKILTEMLRRHGPTITAPNEFHRNTVSLANKLGEHPDDVYAIVTPILKQLITEMLIPPKPQEGGTERSNHGRRQFIERDWSRLGKQS